jgi:hypothetical protein
VCGQHAELLILDLEVLVTKCLLYQNQHISSPLRKQQFRNTTLVSVLLLLVDGNTSSTVVHIANLLTADSTYTIPPLTQTTQSSVACMKTEGYERKWHNINLKMGGSYAPDMSCMSGVPQTADTSHNLTVQRVFRTFRHLFSGHHCYEVNL